VIQKNEIPDKIPVEFFRNDILFVLRFMHTLPVTRHSSRVTSYALRVTSLSSIRLIWTLL